MRALHILVVEDDPVVADDICTCLEASGHQPLGPAYTLSEAMQLTESQAFDLALLDIHLEQHGEGIKLASHIRSFSPVPIIFLTASADERTLEEAKHVHPEHYLLKPFNVAQLNAALAIVLHNYREPDAAQQRLQRILKFNAGLPEPLSRREVELVMLLLEGLSNEEIAGRLFLSLHTVKSHMKRIFQKTDASSRAHLVSMLHAA